MRNAFRDYAPEVKVILTIGSAGGTHTNISEALESRLEQKWNNLFPDLIMIPTDIGNIFYKKLIKLNKLCVTYICIYTRKN